VRVDTKYALCPRLRTERVHGGRRLVWTVPVSRDAVRGATATATQSSARRPSSSSDDAPATARAELVELELEQRHAGAIAAVRPAYCDGPVAVAVDHTCIDCGCTLKVPTRPAHVFPKGLGGRLTTTTTSAMTATIPSPASKVRSASASRSRRLRRSTPGRSEARLGRVRVSVTMSWPTVSSSFPRFKLRERTYLVAMFRSIGCSCSVMSAVSPNRSRRSRRSRRPASG
jgi:hypothetical protein